MERRAFSGSFLLMFCVLLFADVVSQSLAVTPVPHQTVAPELGRCVCGEDYRPVCGNDLKSYHNYCELLCAKRLNLKLRKLRDGPCVFENKS